MTLASVVGLALGLSSMRVAASPSYPVEGVVRLDFEKQTLTDEDSVSRLHKRDRDTYEEEITNGQIGYFTTIRVGTPPQELSLHLDTGSADIWLPSVHSPVCQPGSEKECLRGTFDANGSSTYETLGEGQFQIVYYDRTYSVGDYFRDVLEIGGARIENTTMGLGRLTNIPYGLAGIGYHHVVALTRVTGQEYYNLPLHMEQQGLISTVGYSLWLNDLNANKGSLLFGGIDKAKFTGPLKKVPVITNRKGKYDFFAVPLTNVKVATPERNELLPMGDEAPVRAILDSGATLCFLPNKLAHAIWREVGAVWFRDVKAAMLPCSKAQGDESFTFQFGGPEGPTVRVAVNELVIDPADWPSGYPIVGSQGEWEGEKLCQFGIRNHSQAPYILGDTFMRSAYLVHDLVNHEVGIAQTKHGATGTDVIPFESFGARIPDLDERDY